MVAGARLRHQQQQRVHLVVVPTAGEQAKPVGGAVDPVIVAVDHQEWVAVDHRRRLDQPAAGLEQKFAFVGDGDREIRRLGCEMGFKRIGEIVDVDHQLADPGSAQPVEHMIDQRLAGQLDQRLGPGRGQRPHPLAQASGHDHRRVRHFGDDFGAQSKRAAKGHWGAVQKTARLSAGTLVSNQARNRSSPGAARLRSSRPHMRGWKLR